MPQLPNDNLDCYEEEIKKGAMIGSFIMLLIIAGILTFFYFQS